MSDKKVEPTYLSQRLLLSLNEAIKKLEAVERDKSEPIAIIGMGCRFPGKRNHPQAYWNLLHNGIDAITEVPLDRWNCDAYYDSNPESPGKMYTRYGAFIEDIDQFDPQFFGVSPREAISIDPQQRLLLEVTWEALEHSGQVPEKLRGSQTGVFIGFFMEDYSRLSVNSGDCFSIDAYNSLGNLRPLAAGRLAYVFDWQGPTFQVDTACSSSLLAMHLACQSLRAKESNLALAGGVNLILTPEATIGLCKLRALSPDGHCKTFDATANGYVRGEGCGMVVLKRLSDALADKDNILAVIRGSAVNHDGRSNGITAPNGTAQEAVIRQALKNAKVEPKDIQYVETHGTGTPLGDPIEVLALSKVLSTGRTQDTPLHIGSVKTNFGHLEGAAGVASLMKVVLALQHQTIPPSLHFQTPNPYIPWQEIPVKVPTVAIPWAENNGSRLAGVSSFSMSGTNVHLILEQAPQLQTATPTTERPWHILKLSAQTPEALQSLAKSYEDLLNAAPEISLTDLCFTANTGRSDFNHRLGIITTDKQALADKLAKIMAGEEANDVFSGKISSNSKLPKIAFLFTGQGSQYVNMGRQLYETQPVFRRALNRCDQILESYLKESILEVIYPENNHLNNNNNSVIDQTAYTQPALFAIEYALFKLWQSWGIKPDVVMGHSVGEYVAATIAGVFSLEDGLKLIATRAKLIQQLPVDGMMVSLMAPVEQVKAAIAGKEDVVIAAFNGPQSTVISGAEKPVRDVAAQMEAKGFKSKELELSHAFHSPLMQPMVAEFKQVAEQVNYSQPRIKFISNVTGQIATEELLTPEYWCRHILSPVNFVAGMQTLHEQGCEVFLECGSKPVLLGLGRWCLPENVGIWLPSLRFGQDDWQQMLTSLSQLYVIGVKVDWQGFDLDYPQRRKVILPTYPFQRKSYWCNTKESITMTKDELSNNFSPKSGVQSHKQDQQDNPQRLEKILAKLRSLMGSVLKLPPEEIDIQTPLLEMGADSIVFLEASQNLKTSFGVNLSIRQLFEELNTLDALGNYIDSHMPDGLELEDTSIEAQDQENTSVANDSPLEPETPSYTSTSNTSNIDRETRELSFRENINQQSILLNSPGSSQVGATALEAIMSQQLQTMAQLSEKVIAQMSQLMTEQLSVLKNQGMATDARLLTQPPQIRGTVSSSPPEIVKSNPIIPGETSQINLTKSKEFLGKQGNLKLTLEKPQQLSSEVKTKGMQFSLYYFGSYEAEFSQDKYNLLFAGAKFADQNNFIGIWLPERHFHAFGGFSPNPSVLAAALARETQSIQLRAGSVVLPIHHPIRVAEDWAMIDNISQGRVGIAFASGWHPNDFVFAPDAYERRRELMFESIETVQKLWVGEPIQFVNGAGIPVEIKIFPMPRQKALPTWVTIVNNPETYIKAGEIGAGVLTNLMGQTIEELVRNIQLYRQALAEHGHEPSTGKVTVLLHTFVGNDLQQVRELARQPFYNYLSSSLGLFQSLVKSQGLSVANFEQLSEDDKNYILSAAYDRYVQTSALIGTPESCVQIVEKLVAIGVDEIACLIDFGVEPENVLANLPDLNALREIFQTSQTFPEGTPDPDWLYTLEWQNQPSSVVGDKVDLTEATGRWLIFADEQGIGNSLADGLSARGQTCSLIYPSSNHIASDTHKTHIIDPTDSHGFSQLLESYASSNQLPIRGIVHLWSLNTPAIENLTIDALEDVQQLICGTALSLVQAAIRKIDSQGIPPKFWFVTQQAVMPTNILPTGFVQASLWGFARTVAMEYPDNWGGLIDLDTYHSVKERARELLMELITSQGEDQIALHQGNRYVARLARYSSASDSGKGLMIAPLNNFLQPSGTSTPSKELVGTTLITGGFGVLGIKFAQWLVTQGVKHLILCGRRSPSPEVQQTIAELEKTGIKIKVALVDITNATDVSNLLAQIKNQRQENWPPLRNIFHLAGVIDDKGLTQQTWQKFKTVQAPKVLGTWNLHILTQDLPLDRFVVFSSIVALLGSPGQSNYGAANAFMDALIHYRRSQGLPGLSLNWGGWNEAKVASQFDSRPQQLWKDYLNQRWQEAGIELIATHQGFQVLQQLLRTPITQVGIIPIDWSQFSKTPGINQRSFFSNFIQPLTPIRIPLSEAQKQLWILAQVSEAGSIAYHTSAYMELRGQLELELLQQAVQQVVNRHESLRTVIDSQGEWQQILPSINFDVPLIDYSSDLVEAENAQQAQLSIWLRQRNCQPFDLTTGPLLRIEVLKLAPQRHVLIIVGHHIVVDGWSAENILQEIGLFYSALCNGSVTSLESPLQFREFLTWQNQQSQTEEMTAHKSFWLAQLATKPPVLELPTDRIRPPVKTYKASRQQLELDPSFCQQLRSFSQGQKCTLFMTLLTGYLILLHRLTGQNEIIVGIPTSGRSLPGSQTMVGHASHLLPIQSCLGKDPITVQDFLAGNRTKLLDAYEHQDYPFAELLNQLALVTDHSRPHLVSVTFNLEPPIPTAPMGNLDIKLLPRPLDFNHYDLDFNLIDLKTHLVLEAGYNKNLFQESTIQRWIGHFCAVLKSIIQNPQQDVANLSLLTEQERYQLLVEWNDRAVNYPRHQCIHQLFEAQVESTPDTIAVIFEDEQLTYHELNARANQLAHYLQSLGVGTEVLVGIFVERSIEMVVGLLGILKAGGAYVPLDPNYPQERLSYILADSGVKVLLTQESLLESLPEHQARVVCLDSDWGAIEQHSHENLDVGVSSDNLAYGIYTSGSTGKPKGVLVAHQNLVNHSSAIASEYNLSARDRVLQFAALSFDVVIEEIFPSWLSGATVVLRPQELFASFADLVEFIKTQRLTVLNLPAAFWHKWVLDLSQSDEHLPSCLRLLVVGSEQVQWSRVAMWQKYVGSHIKLYNAYGPTEATITATVYQVDLSNQEGKTGSVPIGLPIANTQVYILDSNLQPVAVGVAGELYIGGDGLARGYLNRPELTEEKFIPNPFSDSKSQRLYKTGDLARYSGDGNIEFVGRVDHQVKIRGFRIELGEIEAVLNTHPQIQQAVVIATEDISGNKRLVAYVVTRDESLTINQLREFLRSKLPEYMMPSAFVTLDTLPLTVNGKVDCKALPSPDGEISREQEYVAPRTEIEQILTNIWQELLLKAKVSIHDNFFEIGGDSILSIQAVSRAKNSGIQITPKQIFQNQTIAELARVANTTVTVNSQQGIVTGVAPLTPIQQWFFAQNRQEAHHFNQSVLLQIPHHLQTELIETALKKLLEHHDALRLRFTSEASEHKQINQGLDDTVPFTVVDLSSTPRLEQPQALSQIATEFQASLNFSDGPLMQVVMFNLGREGDTRLLIIIHHLAIDGVSWRILLSDLETIYQQLIATQPIQLSAKTTAFIDWAEKLNQTAQSERIKQELDYWLNQPWSLTTSLPLDYAHKSQENTVGNAASVSVKLNVEETRTLLGAVNEAYQTQINDILLSALVVSLAEWTGNSTLVIDLEGHGREELFSDVDLSRTVGWFTSLFPVLLQLPAINQPASVIKSIKEQLRAIPNRGIGYGILRYLCEDTTVNQKLQTIYTAEISFNYLGQFDQVQSQTGWKIAPESTGENYSSKQICSHLLDIDALVVEGELQINWTYSSNVHTRATVENLAQSYVQAIRSIIEHCQLEDAFGYTPSDFPDAQLNQLKLDELLAAFKTKKIESIYPLSPMQQGMLFHSLYAPESGVYFDQITLNLKGNINFAAFESAWQKIVDRHSVLRTFFVWGNSQAPLQIVLKQVNLPWNNLDWQGLSPTEQQHQLKDLLQTQRDQGFQFNQAPLMECTLIQITEDTCTFSWSHHHILLDGWCLSIIFKEVLSCYEALIGGKTCYLPTPPRYQDYIAWLHSQNRKAAIEFWQKTLQGFKAPTSLIVDKPKYQKQQKVSDYKKLQLRLSAQVSHQLQSVAQRHHVTLSTIVQAAWGLLLSHYSGEQDVVFGVTVSGRTGSLSGVENMVGLLINTLPLRLQISPQQQIIPWLEQIQQLIVELQQYSYTPLFEIQAMSELPGGIPLFESLVGFENYPIDSSLFDEGGLLQPSNIESFGQNNYPLTVVVVPSDELLVEIRYDTLRFEEDKIGWMLRHLQTILSVIVENPQQTVGEIPLLKESEKEKLFNQSLKKLKQIKRNLIKVEAVTD